MDKEIENRIEMEIIVDAYNPEEAAMGWYYYLEKNIDFPFQAMTAKGKSERTIIGMADSTDCLEGMYVLVNFNDEDELLFSLEDILPIKVNQQSQQAISDWKYWLNMGYNF
ncbi:calcium-binding protein [Desulforhopalus vacuolatus]|uniref:calcium-binding protein n=1 Tax=Desulforhopalus vacuolatus TaxID=40414 RepID=UPI001966A74E|nr:calcium-binding protein [Desulforhopalus vacuolatus]MBM9521231.1 calcium-binding protein [Desulforhopalus vacuolatus]